MTPRADMETALAHVVDDLGDDELEILLALGMRLHAGRKLYGELRLATDSRNFVAEAGEEVIDALSYVLMWMRQRARERARGG